MAESAFIIPVPEAESLVGALRAQFDPTAEQGIPPHITVLYPFMPLRSITNDVLDTARLAVAEMSPFEFRLASIGRFPGVLYLAPDPVAPFVAFIERMAGLFPEFPRYGGQFSSVIPHLTVAHGSEDELTMAENRLRSTMRAQGTVVTTCSRLVLIENSSGRWKQRHVLSIRETVGP